MKALCLYGRLTKIIAPNLEMCCICETIHVNFTIIITIAYTSINYNKIINEIRILGKSFYLQNFRDAYKRTNMVTKICNMAYHYQLFLLGLSFDVIVLKVIKSKLPIFLGAV